MFGGPPVLTVKCLPFREYFSSANMKSMFRGFVYEYETPKIVTIHSVSIALMCRLIQLLILIYGIAYLMVHKKGYQVTDTSIISSVTLKVKGIGYNQTSENNTLVIDGADYIVPPQENNALFLMTNFIRTDQKHGRCSEAYDKDFNCTSDKECQPENPNFQKANGKWTGRCELRNDSLIKSSKSILGLCELEGWCPVENDRNIPNPILDALNFTIFIKNFIEFPSFKVKKKNIEQTVMYLRTCNFDEGSNKICPIFRVKTLLDIVEKDPDEQEKMLKSGGVIRIKIDWKCNLDKPLNQCLPEYSFGRLDEQYKQESFSHGFNFRFASHWKHGNQPFRTLTKAFGLRFIISVSGHAGRFDIITLSLNIGSLIGILGLATFVCDIVALYVHRSSNVYRQQKFQDVDMNLLHLKTLNSLPEGMMSDDAKRKYEAHLEQAILTGHVIENTDPISINHSPHKEKFRRNKENHHQQQLYDNTASSPSPTLPSNNCYQQTDISNSSTETPSMKQRRSTTTRPSQLTYSSNTSNDKCDDKLNITYVDEDSPDVHETKQILNTKTKLSMGNGNEHLNRPSPKIETFL